MLEKLRFSAQPHSPPLPTFFCNFIIMSYAVGDEVKRITANVCVSGGELLGMGR